MRRVRYLLVSVGSTLSDGIPVVKNGASVREYIRPYRVLLRSTYY
jgi:hypothetical protein